ncbi:MAG: hypothetical protein GY950_30200, partial [bacterium]|nr:hypothetical protein [bacterium]
VLMAVILGMMFQSGCKLFKVYDIEGTWLLLKVVNGVETELTVTFVGSREIGEVFVDNTTYGTYQVEYDTDLGFFLVYFPPGGTVTDRRDNFTGGFDDTNTMSGTVEVLDVSAGIQDFGDWTAIRQSETL